MSNKRASYSPELKFKIWMLALSEQQTVAEISSAYEIHGTQISKWKKELQEHGAELFSDTRKKDTTTKKQEKEIERLYWQIGKLTVENDWMKKKSGMMFLRD